MKSIHDRPTIVEIRRQIGHWKGDLIIGAGHRSAIATLVERKARHTILVPIRGTHSAQEVGDALIEVFNRLPPWQGGTNKNANGLLRQYFPTGSDLNLASDQRLREVADDLNARPRACLEDRTPLQLMARRRTHPMAS